MNFCFPGLLLYLSEKASQRFGFIVLFLLESQAKSDLGNVLIALELEESIQNLEENCRN